MADQAPQATLKANCRRMVVSYGIVAEVTGPSYIDLQVRTYYVSFPPEVRPEFLSLEFWTKLILPGNDLIPTCVPTESGNAAEFRGFRTLTPGRNRTTKRNAHPRLPGHMRNRFQSFFCTGVAGWKGLELIEGRGR